MVKSNHPEFDADMRQALEQWLGEHAKVECPDLELLVRWLEGHLNEEEAREVELFLARDVQWRKTLLELRQSLFQSEPSRPIEIEKARALIEEQPVVLRGLQHIVNKWMEYLSPFQAAVTFASLVFMIYSGMKIGTHLGLQATVRENNFLLHNGLGNGVLFDLVEGEDENYV